MKYLEKISQRLIELKNGIEKNSDKWKTMPEDPVFVQKLIDEINSTDTGIQKLRIELSQKYFQARVISREKQNMIDRLEKRAIGIHAENPDKLEEYGILIKK